jgi:hypothetical protein
MSPQKNNMVWKNTMNGYRYFVGYFVWVIPIFKLNKSLEKKLSISRLYLNFAM